MATMRSRAKTSLKKKPAKRKPPAKKKPRAKKKRLKIARATTRKKAKKPPSRGAEARRLRVLGDKHYRGVGVARDFGKARDFYIRAAELRDPASMENLVFFYSKGDEGAGIDLAEALRWAKRLADETGDDSEARALEAQLAAGDSSSSSPPLDRSLAGQRAFFADRIRAANLDRLKAAIESSLSPSIRLVASGEAPAPGSSRLGGSPDLPSDTSWPPGPNGPLSFIAQLNCAELPSAQAGVALPPSGLLSFFYDLAKMPWGGSLDEQASIAVLFTPPDVELVETAKPRDLVAPHKYAHVELTPIPVHANIELTLPSPRTKECRGFGLTDDEGERYWDAVWGTAERIWPGAGSPFHRMFGHADANQGDMTRRLAYLLAGKSDQIDTAPDPKCEAEARSFRLLLQVDTDEALKSHWGDGRLFYWIRDADIAARRFGETLFQFQG